jgi:hypothetical protein
MQILQLQAGGTNGNTVILLGFRSRTQALVSHIHAGAMVFQRFIVRSAELPILGVEGWLQ